MDHVKHCKVVSSLPETLEKNSIYYVRVGEGFDLYVTNNLGVVTAKKLNYNLDTTNFTQNLSSADDTMQKAFETLDKLSLNASNMIVNTDNFDGILSSADDTVQKALDTIDDYKRWFDIEPYKHGNNSSGGFYERYRARNHSRNFGAWNGWPNGAPVVIPYNCRVIKGLLAFQVANFDWRSSAGSIFLDIGFIAHTHNSTMNERILRFEIEGNFTGNSTPTGNNFYVVNIDNITSMSGNNYFNEGEIIGLLLRSSTSVPGRIYRINNAYHKIIFEEI